MHKIDRVFVVFLTGFLLIFWWPTRNLPFWWDSAGTVVHTSLQFLKTNFKNLISGFARPSFFTLLLAIFWKVLGQSLFVAHFLNLIFAFLVLFYTFLLGKEIMQDSLANLVGFSSAIRLLFTPLFLTQLGIVYVEIPMLAFVLMTVYYAIKKNFSGYLISASLMVLTKEFLSSFF